jgi:hypothetical protein
MTLVTTGLTNGGVTAHYNFSYDNSLANSPTNPNGPEPARTNAVIAASENDYNLIHGWFGGNINVTGMMVQVTLQSNGASWSGSSTSSTIQLKAQGKNYSNNSVYLRYLLIAEVVEIFMMTQNTGWFQGSSEGSKGEGLSRFLSGQFLIQNGYLGVGIDANYALADLWLNSSREDFVNNAPNDNGANATNGCTTLFIYYLFDQLRYSINQIVGAGSSTLAGVYRRLTRHTDDPFPVFKLLLESTSAVSGPNLDDPWPLSYKPVDLWIKSLYLDLLNRNPSQTEINNWLSSVVNGVNLASVADGFLRSQEYCTIIVNSFYNQLLDRQADPSGLVFWSMKLQNDVSIQDVIVGFCNSDEYKSKHPVPDQFVESLYNKLLSRHSDPSGLQFWINQITSGTNTTAQVIQPGFLRSEEYALQRATECYAKFLGRNPDPTGLNFWIQMIQNGLSLQGLTKGFVTSEEYKQRSQHR